MNVTLSTTHGFHPADDRIVETILRLLLGRKRGLWAALVTERAAAA